MLQTLHIPYVLFKTTPLTLCFEFEVYKTNYMLETTGMHAKVLTVETGK